MYKLKTVENMVLNVLISTPDARDDNRGEYGVKRTDLNSRRS